VKKISAADTNIDIPIPTLNLYTFSSSMALDLLIAWFAFSLIARNLSGENRNKMPKIKEIIPAITNNNIINLLFY
jgi:hypothetical protein